MELGGGSSPERKGGGGCVCVLVRGGESISFNELHVFEEASPKWVPFSGCRYIKGKGFNN